MNVEHESNRALDRSDPAAADGAHSAGTLSPAAQRALAEAQERRQKAVAERRAREIGGRDGPEPVRYGDWEVKGIASDF